MAYKSIRLEVDRGVALCTLDRPDRLNAWTTRMGLEYHSALLAADEDPAVRVIVVTGGGRGFCAGADKEALGALAAGRAYEDPRLPDEERPDLEHAFAFSLGLSKPVIAAVNGPAAGVGFVLMCFCDLRFAASGAKLTTSSARLGLPAEYGVSWMLSRLIGPANAADLLLSSRVVLAEEALTMGLVNRVYPADDLLAETLGYARTMAAETSPSSVKVIKAQIYADLLTSLDDSARRAVELMLGMIGSADFVEGVTALREKRPPRF
jgi:enoyl-CoA hydratase/carnithine racemase